MSTTTDQPTLAADDVAAMLRAVVEASEVLRPIDDPGPNIPEFDFDPDGYVEFALYCAIYPSPPGAGGALPLRADLLKLIADFRTVCQQRGLNAGICKAFVPAEPRADAEARLYFRLGAYVLLARATPETGLRWRLGLSINVDPDAIEDDD